MLDVSHIPGSHRLELAYRDAFEASRQAGSIYAFRPALTSETLEALLFNWAIYRGRPTPTVLEVGPENEAVAQELVRTPDTLSGDGPKYILRVEVNPERTDGSWGLR